MNSIKVWPDDRQVAMVCDYLSHFRKKSLEKIPQKKTKKADILAMLGSVTKEDDIIKRVAV